MAITKAELDALVERDTGPERRILSVYLDCDQSRQENLNRGFTAALTQRLRGIEQGIPDENGRSLFRETAERVLSAVERAIPRGKSLVFFADGSSDFFFEKELAVNVHTEVRWEPGPYLRPLVEMLDEYERYAVVLVNRQEARLFTVFMGEIEENREIFTERRKRFKQTAKDNVLSQPNLQRRDDEHAQMHLRDVADALDRLASGKVFDRLVLGGPHEVVKALEGRLSKRLRELEFGELGLAVDANEREVLDATMKLQQRTERSGETIAVDRLITAASKRSQAVLGLAPTLEAMHVGSIMRLVYVQNYAQPGGQCTKCESLFAGEPGSCPYCGGEVRPAGDVVTRLVQRVVDSGGEAESVFNDAADRLRKHGSIGAFLRF